MQYSYEHWTDPPPGLADSSKEVPESAVLKEEQSFPFAEELKELEDSLALGIDDGMEAYRRYQETRQQAVSNDHPEAGGSASDEESDWDALAKLVAGHVMSFMAENPLQAEVNNLRAQVDELYRDNRIIAEQVQRLVIENDQLRQATGLCEVELTRYRHLTGNLFLKL